MPDTLVWAEGQPGWLALRECVELQAAWGGAAPSTATDSVPGDTASNGAAAGQGTDDLKQQAAWGAPAPGAALETAAGAAASNGAGPGQASAARQVSLPASAAPAAALRGRLGPAAKAVRAAPAARLDPELAAFRAEISAIDGDAASAAGAAPQADPTLILDPPSTPPPDEREFEDDDGTWYAWDPALRKFVAREGELPPEGAPGGHTGGPGVAAAPDYDVSDMTFEADEEVLPEYRCVKVSNAV